MCGVQQNIDDIIISRRSIRLYTQEPVDNSLIERLLGAAMYAPSANNRQPWHFIVIDDKEIMESITQLHPNATMLKQAQRCIIVCADTQLQPAEGYYSQDCAAAIQNILLSAHGAGLGAVWLGIYPRKERMEGIKTLLSLPDNIVPIGGISIGWPHEHRHVADRFDAARIHNNKW